ncbi:hypothetical protein DVR12_27360 [Chitinophaga silvatica]|uniref:site-specific DNA-methyltransferase (cytosine-N(4)-specific) n=1 Tax=Chitinophaga silvatica TaxID=2282649 RepID=A0A3E1Y1V4_9BACT|nr:DNA methyltransferase [Chitinophaga silvatica]RFS18665.1 hypothetical protein DVR12_27360 [Chitinophaga silvatica]
MSKQQELFKEPSVICGRGEDKIVYNSISAKSATFKSGTNKKIHSWFRLTPSYGPDLVDIMLEKLNYQTGDIVLDPFCGASTTLIQCKLSNIECFGFEINPLLHFVGVTSLNWNLNIQVVETAFSDIERLYTERSTTLREKDVEDLDIELPKIHNVFRWWRKDVLKELVILRQIIRTADLESPYKDFFLLAIAGVLVPDLTNVTLGKLQLHFINRDNHEINVFSSFSKQVEMMLNDLKVIEAEYKSLPPASLYHTDSTDIAALNIEKKATLVLTSPPYPNRYSYVWNTRPHLYFLEIFDNAKQASALDLKTIGGTWGVATSNLQKGIIAPEYEIIKEVVEPVVSRIRETDNLMANYVMKYFNLIAKQIVEMEKVVSPDVKIAYVVGNSEIKGVYVETDVLLGKIFEGLNLGYTTFEITRFRKRNSGVDLYESIVYARK